jgi:DNA-binding NarL/FixJ family response regulator
VRSPSPGQPPDFFSVLALMSPRVVSCTLKRMAVTILIVDDHDGFRVWARELLEREGLVVLGEVSNGADAVRAARSLVPDVVLLDVRLPDGNGFDIAKQIATFPGGPAVVMTSSHDPRDFRRWIAASPARGFVSKDDLSRAALEQLLEPQRP